MKTVLVTVLLFCVVSSVFGSVGIIPADKTPGHPGHCNSDKTGPMEKGSEKSLENCVQATCQENGDIQLASCGSIAVPEKCKLEANKDLPYPKCCPTPKC